MLYQKHYFSKLTENLTVRSERAAQGLLGLNSQPLRRFLHQRLTAQPGTPGSWLADPVFEPTFGWEESYETMESLAGSALLHQQLAEVMAAPPQKLAEEYTFPKARHPFTHQLSAWKLLNQSEPQSLVVTSGTGSGKTECFLVPVLNQLANEIDNGEDLEGIRALFIYPLNALINSQQNRLDAWTDGFNGKIRHCLYTGALEEEKRSSDQQYKGQVIDRKSLRESPPQILVTNATMLEYMLVRKNDAPILQKSEGTLRWIILDEAHTHIGSQAAEMALLLRRVMLAFKVDPKNVRFVATSATFGSDEKTIENLRNFLADIGGINTHQVHVVQGRRDIPALIETSKRQEEDKPEKIWAIEEEAEVSEQRYKRLEQSQIATHLRQLFIENGNTRPQSLSQLVEATRLSVATVLSWLDLLSATKNKEGIAFLPLRAHLFHNVIPTIRACVDKNCLLKQDTLLNDERWPFGLVYIEERTHCNCGSPLMPLVSCGECNESFLHACLKNGKLIDESLKQIDEFTLEDDSPEEEEEAQVEQADHSIRFLITSGAMAYSNAELLDKTTQKLTADSNENCIVVHLVSNHSNDQCPHCHAQRHDAKGLFRTARVGTPFTLSTVIGNLLEYCPQDKQPSGKPFQGRKLISFTDSRQGTARIAVKLQQDSERNRIRGLVYQHLLRSQPATTLTLEDQQDLEALQKQQAQGKLTQRESRYLKMLMDEQSKAGKNTEISWQDMVQYLASTPELQMGMLNYYHDLRPGVFTTDDSYALAAMLLAREFYRRPKRANNLETLGLVQITYPALSSITQTPTGWPSDKGLAAWHSYLKVLLDFFVRENTILSIDRRWQKLMGAKVSPKWAKEPVFSKKPEKLPTWFKRWPTVNATTSVQARPVLLLCKAFGWSPKTHRDRLDTILNAAWQDLTQKAKLLVHAGDGYQLDLKNLSFRIPKHVYFCPVTRRFIDTTFEQLSPYTPRTEQDLVVKTIPYQLPHPAEALLHLSGEEALLAIRSWLETEPKIQELRKEGLWTDITDLTVEGGNYFQAAEHSAQQPKKKLDRYEMRFKEGRLNLLSCSTTMEMGVDIGGISAVVMNNVPPHPANYLQRAGRAGRRREGRSLAVTVCKNTPHDQYVFNDPTWPFKTPMRMPKVSLQSTDLVQRHVNSWLLSYWLKQIINADELKSMTSGVFFLTEEQPSRAARFKLWLESHPEHTDNQVKEAIKHITHRSALSHTPITQLLVKASDALSEIIEEWVQEHAVNQEQLLQIKNTKVAAYRAMHAQIKRLEDEYLLSELANKRFLPGYGFPTDIVNFDNRCHQTLKQEEAKKREDNRALFRSLASRDRITGLREYSPGAELVMDGLVYRSSGITLNWHSPASEQNVKELQLFKKAWFCSYCGASGITKHPNVELICEQCDAVIKPNNVKEYLVPSGFAVDFHDEPHNNVSQLQYIPVTLPWINIPADWVSLINPALGHFRSSNKAQIFHYASGHSEKGFAVCLECGRTESMLGHDDTDAAAHENRLPVTFRQEHTRLRGGKNDDGNNICVGSLNSWKIKQDIHLGHDSLTDALEISLRNPVNGDCLHDAIASYSIAVALREAIAGDLGIQAEELGCDTQEIRVNGRKASAIRVFDLRSGGYTTQVAERINQRSLWKRVIKRLESCGCAQACQRCLLSFDTRFQADKLDRHEALKWVNREWLNYLELPSDFAVFGPKTRSEIVTLQEALVRELARDASHKIIGIHLPAPAEMWDLAGAKLFRSQTLKWLEAGHAVHFYLPETTYDNLPEDQKNWLARLAFSGVQICLHAGKDSPEVKGLTYNLSLQRIDNSIAWASDNMELTAPNIDWNIASLYSTVVTGPMPELRISRKLTYEELLPKIPAGLIKVEVGNHLDGPISTFASNFWQLLQAQSGHILEAVLTGKEAIHEVSYTDRYVKTPLVVNTLINTIYELKNLADQEFTVKIVGRMYDKSDGRNPQLCRHNWPNSDDRDEAIRQATEYCGLNATVESVQKLPHCRQLQIQLNSGKRIIIQFDQGFSFWDSKRGEEHHKLRFNFNASNLGEEIDRINCSIGGMEEDGTQIFLSIE